MIRAKFTGLAAGFPRRLAGRAAALARAEAARRRAGRDEARHWRDARLLWPLFTGD